MSFIYKEKLKFIYFENIKLDLKLFRLKVKLELNAFQSTNNQLELKSTTIQLNMNIKLNHCGQG